MHSRIKVLDGRDLKKVKESRTQVVPSKMMTMSVPVGTGTGTHTRYVVPITLSVYGSFLLNFKVINSTSLLLPTTPTYCDILLNFL